jgi:hypothetical protein
MKLVNVLVSVLSSKTVMQGLRALGTAEKARELILAHKSRQDECYCFYLFIGGMGLQKEDISECKSPKERNTTDYLISWSLDHW